MKFASIGPQASAMTDVKSKIFNASKVNSRIGSKYWLYCNGEKIAHVTGSKKMIVSESTSLMAFDAFSYNGAKLRFPANPGRKTAMESYKLPPKGSLISSYPLKKKHTGQTVCFVN